jgi:hypothetical protein
MVARWQIAGNAAQVDVYPQSPHGFISFPTRLAAMPLVLSHQVSGTDASSR